MSQLEKDIFNNACDRLETCLKDTKMRCEVADLGSDATLYILTYPALLAVIKLLTAIGFNKTEILKLAEICCAKVEKRANREKNQSSENTC
jgi:hypothetical protein